MKTKDEQIKFLVEALSDIATHTHDDAYSIFSIQEQAEDSLKIWAINCDFESLKMCSSPPDPELMALAEELIKGVE